MVARSRCFQKRFPCTFHTRSALATATCRHLSQGSWWPVPLLLPSFHKGVPEKPALLEQKFCPEEPPKRAEKSPKKSQKDRVINFLAQLTQKHGPQPPPPLMSRSGSQCHVRYFLSHPATSSLKPTKWHNV